MAACKLAVSMGFIIANPTYRIIADARLCFRALKGHAIIAIFADKDGEELMKWYIIEVAQGLEQEVAEMGRSGIATSFKCTGKLTVS